MKLNIDKLRDKLTPLWGLLIVVGIPVSYLYIMAKSNNRETDMLDLDNPRLKKGVDTLYVDDSVYVIHFVIDSVYKAAYEPEDDNDRDY